MRVIAISRPREGKFLANIVLIFDKATVIKYNPQGITITETTPLSLGFLVCYFGQQSGEGMFFKLDKK